MACTVSGYVLDDSERTSTKSSTDAGIEGCSIVLFDTTTAAAQETTTDRSGYYTFDVSTAGTYTLYEPVVINTATPPTTFTQPANYNLSTTQRKRSLTITSTDITSGTAFSDYNFGHTSVTPFDCAIYGYQVNGDPSVMSEINLISGDVINLGTLTPDGKYNAIGYNINNNLIFGYNLTTYKVVCMS